MNDAARRIAGTLPRAGRSAAPEGRTSRSARPGGRRGQALAVLGLAGSVAMLAPAAAALALAGTPAPAGAQQVWQEQRDGRGWIGISFEVTGDWRGRSEAVYITEVMEGSPASEAGVRAGDRLLAINDLRSARELASAHDILRVDAGDRVVLLVERDGERHRFRLRAAPRPDDFYAGRRIEISLQADSLVETWARSMDSLRVRLVTGERVQDIRVRPTPAGVDAFARATEVAAGSEYGVRAPFEFFVFRGEAHDSLRDEMQELNDDVGRLQREIGARERELRRRFGARADADRDSELRRLKNELERLASRSSRLETAMAEAARVSAETDYGIVVPRPRTASGGSPLVPAPGEFRPLTPYLMGRNRVAGAEVIDLKPELARYFEVASGVLVVDVAPGTPAAIAGIVPGDVITRIDQVGIRSVEDLRFGVSVAGDSLPVTLIREGSSRQVLLRK